MQSLKDKKGLLKFIIGVIIGILCIIPLFYLGSTLMSIFFSSPQSVLQAEGTLDSLQNTIEPLYIDESTSQPFLLLVPSGWWLLGFDKESKTYVGMFDKEVKPSKECEGEICLCICKNSIDCTKDFACKELSKSLTINHENIAMQIQKYGTQLKITNKEKFYEVEIIE